MFNCLKKNTIDGTFVVMSREQLARASASASVNVLPLTLENLPWNSETRLVEDEQLVRRCVLNMRDPSWYRPREVVMKEDSIRTVQKYLKDLQTEKQYTVGDMEDILGIERSENRLQSTKEWVSILMEAGLSASRLKVIKPFELNIDQIMFEIKNVSNILQDIGDRIRLPGIARDPTDKMSQVDVSESDDVNEDYDYRLKLPFKMIYQAHIDLLVMHGIYDNCYIQLMKVGEQEELDEVAEKKREAFEVELQHPGKEPKVVKKPKTRNFLEKRQRMKIKQKLRQAKQQLDKTESQTSEMKEQVEPKAEVQGYAIDSYGSDGAGQDSSEEDRDINKDSSDVNAVVRYMVDIIKEEMPDTKAAKKKRKRGLWRKITGPLRWIKKKL